MSPQPFLASTPFDDIAEATDGDGPEDTMRRMLLHLTILALAACGRDAVGPPLGKSIVDEATHGDGRRVPGEIDGALDLCRTPVKRPFPDCLPGGQP